MALMIANPTTRGGDVQMTVSAWRDVASALSRTPRTVMLARRILDHLGTQHPQQVTRLHMTRAEIEIIENATDAVSGRQ